VGGGVLWIAVTQALGMGGVEAVSAAGQLLPEHGVRCLAMCGVCAGRRGEVALGDVIIADRMWTYDTGKLKVDVDAEGRRSEHERGDMTMFLLKPAPWTQDAQRFVVDPAAGWLAARPRSYEAQGDWVLERVLVGVDPVADVDSQVRCADFNAVLARLWKTKLLEDGTLTLTEAGRKHIERVLLLHRRKLPEPAAFRTHVGPIASGSKVVEDAGIFERLSTPVRKVLGLEMEAAAIGALAHARGLDYAVVMKGVMDHADPDKSDNFKAFAARASAECLIAFVRAHLPAGDGEDEVLVPGTSSLSKPEKAGPAALLNARHEVVDFVGREELLGELREWCDGDGRVGRGLSMPWVEWGRRGW
jgi:nucleoside phosphorylase